MSHNLTEKTEFLLYQTDDGRTRIDVRLDKETVWLSLNQMAELFQRDKSVISAFEDLVVRLPAKGYGTVEFDMSDERRKLLVDAGRQAMMRYMEAMQKPARPKPHEEQSLTGAGVANKVAERYLME